VHTVRRPVAPAPQQSAIENPHRVHNGQMRPLRPGDKRV